MRRPRVSASSADEIGREVERRGRRMVKRLALALVRALAVLLVAALLAEAARRFSTSPRLLVVAAAGLTVAVLALIDPLALASLTVPGVWIVVRVSGGGVDLSGSDALLTVATGVILPLVPWHVPALRRAVAMIVGFEAVLLLTVIAHPTLPAAVEWGHRLFLTGGSVVVGATLMRAGRARGVLAVFVTMTATIGVLAALASALNGFAPGTVLGFHKNFIGSMALAGLALAFLAPAHLALGDRALKWVRLSCSAGLLGSQSRGAIVALLIGLVVAAVRSGDVRRRSAGILVLLVPLTAFAIFSLRSQLVTTDTGATSSLSERARYRDQAMAAWRDSPVFGQGMRFFREGEFALDSDPHNVIVASLSETGILGLVALLALLSGTVRLLWRLHNTLAVAALAMLVARFAHGVLDIYWVASTQTLPWLIVGMALVTPPVEPPSEQAQLTGAGAAP